MINRRTFLKSAGATGAMLAVTGEVCAASTGMFVALNSTLTGGKVPWPDFVRLAASAGYGGTDVSLAAAMKEGADATKSLLQELKLRTSFASLPVTATGTDENFQKGMETLGDVAKFLSDIGCNRMMTVLPTSSATPADELRKTLGARYGAIGEVLARQNVRLGLEFLGPVQFRTRQPHEFIWRMNDAVAFAKECGPNIGIVLDSWHWYHSGATIDDIHAAGKSRIVTVHLSDAAKTGPDVKDNERLLPGEGVIDLVGFFKALKAVGYEDGISPEPLGRIPPGTPPEEGAKMGLESALSVMRKAGVA
jgi:sugar phosphate isomerase/epimerase